MRILMLASALDCGGVETHVLSLSQGLVSDGHEVCVVSAGGKVADGMERLGIRHVKLPLDKRDPARLFLAKKALERLLRRERFEVIHAHTRLASFIVYPLAKKFSVPLVTTVHAKFSASAPYRALSRWGDLTIAVGEDLRHYLCKSYDISPALTRLIKNGIDTATFSPAQRERDGVFRICFVSRLDKDCSAAAFALCEIAERLGQAIPNLEIIICGGGVSLSQLEELHKKKQGVKNFVKLLGNVENVRDILRQCDLFVGVSRAALEAMSCKVMTLLAGDEGYFGILQTKKDADEASLENFCCRGYPALDPERLLRDIIKTFSLSDAERREVVGMLSDYVRQEHSLDGMVSKTVKVYREAQERVSVKRDGIVLCGYYGFGNMGDDALLCEAIRRARRSFAKDGICALTAAPRASAQRFGVRCVDRSSPLSVCRSISRAKVLVFGGGTILQDSTSLRSLIYYSAIIRYAKSRGARVELWGNGLGVPSSAIGRALMRRSLLLCDRIGLRDTASVSRARSLLPVSHQKNISVEPDLAYDIQGCEASRVDFLLREVFGKDAKLPYGYAIAAVHGKARPSHIDTMLKSLYCLRESGVEILVIPMFPNEDEGVSGMMCDRLGGRLLEHISASDMVGLAKRARLVLGMRLHSLVFARAAGACFVGFGDDEKIKTFCQENGAHCFK